MLVATTASFPGALSAQECGVAGGTGISATGGFMAYDAADLSGPSFGADFTVIGPGAHAASEARAGIRVLLLDGGGDPLLARAVVALPLPVPTSFATCGTIHGGAVRVPLAGDGAQAVAGGVGVRLSRPLMVGGNRAIPFVEIRSLAGWSTGTVFDVNWSGHGFAVGVSAGVQAVVGPLELRAAATMDGFDEGLGITPYPSATGELGVGFRF